MVRRSGRSEAESRNLGVIGRSGEVPGSAPRPRNDGDARSHFATTQRAASDQAAASAERRPGEGRDPETPAMQDERRVEGQRDNRATQTEFVSRIALGPGLP